LVYVKITLGIQNYLSKPVFGESVYPQKLDLACNRLQFTLLKTTKSLVRVGITG